MCVWLHASIEQDWRSVRDNIFEQKVCDIFQVIGVDIYDHDIQVCHFLKSLKCPPPFLLEVPETFSMLAKKGDLHFLNFYGDGWGWLKRGSGFFQGRTHDFLKLFFNCWWNIKIKNVNYSNNNNNNHHHNVLYLLTICKCIQLKNYECFLNIKHTSVLNFQIKIV